MAGDSRSKKVILEVKGGLGNQLFQYAAARSLALELGAELLIERKLGFLLDRQYRRTFELNKLPTIFSDSTLSDSYPFYFDRLLSFAARRFSSTNMNWNSKSHIFERGFSYTDLSKVDFSEERYWLSGYFQDPRYFAFHVEKILSELNPPVPTENSYLEIAKLADDFTLIAVGIRMFEESSSPGAHARSGKSKVMEDYKFVLLELLDSVANPLILVFTTKEFDFLSSLNLPLETVFINADRDFHNAIDILWLLTKCQHHVFNNSTFYWWGATLSQSNYRDTEQQIYCSNNFLNPAIAYSHWKTF
jgi:hypothetical protein